MIFFIVPFLLENEWKSKIAKWTWNLTFIIPSVLILIGIGAVIYVFSLSPILYLLLVLGGYLLFILLQKHSPELLIVAPFGITLLFLASFSLYLPQMEKFRPYDTIGNRINKELKIDKATPLLIQNTLIHNMPYYAERMVIRDQNVLDIQSNQNALALVREESLSELNGFESLWSGYIYDFSSESQFLKFVLACRDADNGDYSKFAKYHLVRSK